MVRRLAPVPEPSQLLVTVWEDDRRASAAAQTKAQARGRELREVVEALRTEGFASAKGLARELTRRGIETPRGKATWTATQVGRLLDAVTR
jgi:hypothetical protein